MTQRQCLTRGWNHSHGHFSSVWSTPAPPAVLQTDRMGRGFLPLTCFVLAVARQLTLCPVRQLQVGFRETDGADAVTLLGTLQRVRFQLQQCWEGERDGEKALCEELLLTLGEEDEGEGEGLESGVCVHAWVCAERSRG